MKTIQQTLISNLKLFRQGKVRDVYDLNDKILIVATDRISAFDVIMPNGIPDKGKILTQMSRFWFEYTSDIAQNHLISCEIKDFPPEIQNKSKTFKNSFNCIQQSFAKSKFVNCFQGILGASRVKTT